jgi:hypothetical protein
MALEKQSTERVKLAKQVELQDIRERIVQLLIPTTTHQDLLRTVREALLRQLSDPDSIYNVQQLMTTSNISVSQNRNQQPGTSRRLRNRETELKAISQVKKYERILIVSQNGVSQTAAQLFYHHFRSALER